VDLPRTTETATIQIGFLAVLALAVVSVLMTSRRRPTKRRYRDLLRTAMGDRDAVERLIELERQRNPSASRGDLIERAIDRWRRDNR
jgi:hypothetical protein